MKIGGMPKEHILKGVLVWDAVDKQFHVPLVDEGDEVQRKFRVDTTPMALLRCTCICCIFPICWVCREQGFVAHRVTHDSRRVLCAWHQCA